MSERVFLFETFTKDLKLVDHHSCASTACANIKTGTVADFGTIGELAGGDKLAIHMQALTAGADGGDDQNTSESYRRCCTSVGWVAQTLALRFMHAEQAWGHDAFFDYVDRWMYEDDTAFVKTIKEATDRDHDKDWAKHRPALHAPTDGWKQNHDDAYYCTAIAK